MIIFGIQNEGQQRGTGENSLFKWCTKVIICKKIYFKTSFW